VKPSLELSRKGRERFEPRRRGTLITPSYLSSRGGAHSMSQSLSPLESSRTSPCCHWAAEAVMTSESKGRLTTTKQRRSPCTAISLAWARRHVASVSGRPPFKKSGRHHPKPRSARPNLRVHLRRHRQSSCRASSPRQHTEDRRRKLLPPHSLHTRRTQLTCWEWAVLHSARRLSLLRKPFKAFRGMASEGPVGWHQQEKGLLQGGAPLAAAGC